MGCGSADDMGTATSRAAGGPWRRAERVRECKVPLLRVDRLLHPIVSCIAGVTEHEACPTQYDRAKGTQQRKEGHSTTQRKERNSARKDTVRPSERNATAQRSTQRLLGRRPPPAYLAGGHTLYVPAWLEVTHCTCGPHEILVKTLPPLPPTPSHHPHNLPYNATPTCMTSGSAALSKLSSPVGAE
eukprot:362898-Chlamydomonas_euryale.AAC.5